MVSFTFDAGIARGPVSRRVAAHYQREGELETRTALLEIAALVNPDYDIAPAVITVPSDASTQERLIFVPRRGGELPPRITSATSASPAIKVHFESDDTSRRRTPILIEYDPSRWPNPQERSTSILLRVENSTQPVLVIPVHRVSRSDGAPEAEPRTGSEAEH